MTEEELEEWKNESIDTDEYEGHSTEYTYEILDVDDGKELFATYALLNDAPILLAEVKRLRRVIEDIESMIPDNHEEVSPILSDILSECHRMLPMFNEVSE